MEMGILSVRKARHLERARQDTEVAINLCEYHDTQTVTHIL